LQASSLPKIQGIDRAAVLSCRKRPITKQIQGKIDAPEGRPLKNAPFCPIAASGSNFNPQNTKCIPAVEIFAFLELNDLKILLFILFSPID